MKKKMKTLLALLSLFSLVLPLCGCSSGKLEGVDLKGHKRMIGVNIHSKLYASYSEKYTSDYINLSAEMGSTLVRINYNPTDAAGVKYIKGIAKKCHAKGMQIMMCMDDKSGSAEEIAERMKFIAENTASFIDYFQIFNETDIWAAQNEDGSYYNNSDWTGMTLDYYNPERVSICVEKVGAAVKAFREAAPEAKLVINIGTRHYPILDQYIEAGISWDIIGFDIYEIDLWDHAAFFKEMEERYPGYDFMVTECNCPPSSGRSFEESQAKWLERFLDIMEAYDSDRMKAVIIYELMDQPNIEIDNGKEFDAESHFGIVNTNSDYSPGKPKEAYYAVQKWILGE